MSTPSAFEPRNPDYDQDLRESFERQGLMTTFAARLAEVIPGSVEIRVPYSTGLTQQDGFFHAGVAIAILDSACGYAAFTLMAPGTRVLTVELKVNLLAPAVGAHLRAVGQVVRSGRTLTICRGDAYAGTDDGAEKHVATILTTMTSVAGHGCGGRQGQGEQGHDLPPLAGQGGALSGRLPGRPAEETDRRRAMMDTTARRAPPPPGGGTP